MEKSDDPQVISDLKQRKVSKKKVKKQEKKNKNTWIYAIFGITFVLSIIFSVVSNILVEKLNIFAAILVLVAIICIGIIFDMIGMSVASVAEAPFHAKASKKHKGAKEAVKLVKYSEKVSSVCNDVIGDVCGVVSGAVGAAVAINISSAFKMDSFIISLIVGAFVASFTVFGKAVGKSFASKNAEDIIYKVGGIIHFISPKDKKKA